MPSNINRDIENIADLPCITCRFAELCDSIYFNEETISDPKIYSPIKCTLLEESLLHNYDETLMKIKQ